MRRLLTYFAESVKQEREGQALSMRELSLRAGVQPSTLSRLENGERTQPTLETVLRVAWALQVDPKYLLPDLVDMKEIFEMVPPDGAEGT